MSAVSTEREVNLWLTRFLDESNALDECFQPTTAEVRACNAFLNTRPLSIGDLQVLATCLSSEARVRSAEGMAVEKPRGLEPGGGIHIVKSVERLLAGMPMRTSCDVLRTFEALQPFTRANGRIGRMLWLWHMKWFGADGEYAAAQAHGFHHCFYRQVMAAFRYIPQIEVSNRGRNIQFVQGDEAVIWNKSPHRLTALELAVSMEDGKSIVGVRLTQEPYHPMMDDTEGTDEAEVATA